MYTLLRPSGLWVAFNPLDPAHDQPLIQAGEPAATSLRPVALPTQAPASERGAAPSAQESVSLELGNPVERELSGGQSHFCKISMTSGQYLRITVSQRGIDVLVALFTPDGKKVGEADLEKATVRSETISTIAEAAGAYRIEVRSAEKTAQTGRYEAKIEELREATAEDKYRVTAESVFREATQKARLLMELGDNDYANYLAVFQTIEGREILRRRTGNVRFGKDRAFATLPIKAGELTKGDYILILFGQTADGKSEEIERYFFRVS